MKKIFTIIVLLATVLDVSAKRAPYKGEMKITPLVLEQVGDSLYVGIKFDFSSVEVLSERSITVIPILVAPSGEHKLMEVEVKGRANFLTTKREVKLMSKAKRELYNQKAPYAVIKGFKSKESKSFTYLRVLAFEPWMKDARLDIREDLCGCGNPAQSLNVTELAHVELEKFIDPYTVFPHFAYVQPKAEALKTRVVVGESFLDFEINKSNIRPEFHNNANGLKKITDIMEEIRADKSITVKGINVIGYASPDGPYKGNQRLSELRAGSLIEYLLPKFNYSRSMYKVVFGGEDWAGLRRMVEGATMEAKDEVLAILGDTTIATEDSRKARLKSIKGGAPYRFIIDNYCPNLRKATCKIDYEIKGFNLDESKIEFSNRPQNLSLNEMFLVANSYPIGSPEFIDVLETAARLFPENETANLNAATVALSRGDLVVAERYLDKVVAKSPEYYNALGVLYMLKGDYSAAANTLRKAKGLQVAEQNLTEIERKLENIQQIEELSKKKRK